MKGDAIVKYSLEGLPNKVLAAEYMTQLPDEKVFIDEIIKQQKLMEGHFPDSEDD